MKIKILSSMSNSTITPSSSLDKTSLATQSFSPTIITPTQTRTSYSGTTVIPNVTGYKSDTSFSSSTTVKNIVRTTKQSIHRLRKKVKNILRNKKLREEKVSPQILRKNSDGERSASNLTFTSHGNIAVNNSFHENGEEKTTVYNTTKSALFYSVSSSDADVAPLSSSTKMSDKINNSLQRTNALIYSQNSTKKVNSQYSNQNSSLLELTSSTKPPLEIKETQDLKPPGGIPPNKKEVDIRKDRILIWDELKDCAQPFGASHDQPIKDDFQSLNPPRKDRFDQWDYNDLNKRVLSSPSFNIGTVTVRAEEIGLVLVILLLWAGAISLFINRWGKLRMLEPYQPQYTAPEPPQPPRPAPPAPPFININIHSTSSMSLNDNFRHTSPVGSFAEWGCRADSSDHLSPRRSIGGMYSMSAGVERSPSMMMTPLSSQRRVRSAVDLVSLVMQEKMNSGSQFAATNV